MHSESIRLRAARVLGEHGWLEHAVVEIEGGKITAIVPDGDYDLDLGPNWLMPALIDSHVHGAAGFDTMDASSLAMDEISAHFARFGVGAFLATTVTAPVPAIEAALKEVRASRERGLMATGSPLITLEAAVVDEPIPHIAPRCRRAAGT